MSTATASVPITDELAALRFAFEELLRVRSSLAINRDRTRRFRSADRRLRRAHSAVQRQLQSIAADLHSMGVSPMELKRIMDEATAPARVAS